MKVVLALTDAQADIARQLPETESVELEAVCEYLIPLSSNNESFQLNLHGNELIYDGSRDIPLGAWSLIAEILRADKAFEAPLLFLSDEFPFENTAWYVGTERGIEELVDQGKFLLPEFQKALDALDGNEVPRWLALAGEKLLFGIPGNPKAGTVE